MSTIDLNPARAGLGAWTSIRRWLLRIHLWVGIAFCIPFAVLGVTGSFLVFDQDFTPAPRATSVGEHKAPTAILAAALASHPERRATAVIMPEASDDPATVRLARADGARGVTQVFVDPVSLAVLETREGVRTPLSDFMHSLHGNFLIGGRDGRSIVGWMGVGMTLLGITGLILWWPRGTWKNSLGVKKGARGVLWHRQMHATVGVLGWIAYIVVSFTGVAISFPQTTTAAMQAVFGGDAQPPRIARIEPLPNTEAIDADRAAATALRGTPGARLGTINLPAEADQPYRITLIAENALAGAPVINAVVDPYRDELLSMRDPRTFQLGDSMMAWQRTLHDGRALGFIWAVLVFLSGLMPPLFAVTGTAMWWLKRKARRQIRARADAGAVGVPAE